MHPLSVQDGIQRAHGFGGRQRSLPNVLRQAFFHVLMPCEIPHIAYRAPGETECGQPHGKAQACQTLKPGIGSNIVRLARVPQRHADGRIQDEMRQGYVACGFMQVPGTAQFGTDNLRQAFLIHVCQQPVVKHRSCVNDPAQRGHDCRHLLYQGTYCGKVRHVAGFRQHRDSLRAEFLQDRFGSWCSTAAAAHQYQIFYAVLRQVTRCRQAKAAKAARHQPGTAGIQRHCAG